MFIRYVVVYQHHKYGHVNTGLEGSEQHQKRGDRDQNRYAQRFDPQPLGFNLLMWFDIPGVL